ncbi:Retrotransposon gag protein [Artemisia annua]|uniref:Retrotransposon gag protein n=1 Tax=Artemisia annua TaxID=35608 RepID=A0A2U1PGY9_ARTAN|nr:Retrotransposon gag protein [Artemisia annua]
MAITRSMGRNQSDGMDTVIRDGVTSSNVYEEESVHPSLTQLQVMFNTFANDFGARIENNSLHQNLRIDDNSKLVNDMKEQMTGLSMHLNLLMNETIKIRDEIGGSDSGTSHESGLNGGNRVNHAPILNLGGIVGNPNQYSSRLTKIEFSIFDGEDLKPWLYKVEQFFQLDQVKENVKVPLASIHMYKRALN